MTTRSRSTAALGLIALIAAGFGCDGAAAPGGSGPSGKADGFGGAPSLQEGSARALAVLHVANTASETTLDDDAGLDRRAADGIVETRSGPDGIDGTADDVPFTDLAALDAVSFVGPAALEDLLLFAQSQGVTARFLRIATFNIRWYGLGGSLFGSLGSEQRSPEIRSFVASQLATADVLVFQEIVDLDLFFAEVVFDLDCISYEPIAGKHQHVVVCHSDRVRIELESDDTDFGFEPLRLSNLRPGVHGVVVDEASDLPIAHMMGVHLKAREAGTAKRLEQAQILRQRVDALAALQDDLPTVFIGDFNTHQTNVTGLQDDDEVLIGEVLSDGSPAMERVPLPDDFTFRRKDGTGFRLDQAWHTPELEVLDVDIPGPCNLDSPTAQEEIDAYFDSVSDHCPVVMTLRREP